MVISLSDALERYNLKWQLKVLDDVETHNEEVARFIADHVEEAVTGIAPDTLRSNPTTWLSNAESKTLDMILQRVHARKFPTASSLDYRKEHGELMGDVLQGQGGEDERRVFLDHCRKLVDLVLAGS